MRQCNGSGSVGDDETSNLHLGSACNPASYMPPQPHSLTPSAQAINQEETKITQEKNSQEIVSHCLGIHRTHG